MVEIRLHNTKTRKKEAFVPIDPQNVRMYVCGPTVYDRAHLGNARPVVVFDTLFRLLRHVYGDDHVTYVRNFTDVDDKINARAAKLAGEGDGRPLEEIIRGLTDETIGWYHADMDALGALRPTQEPRATEWIGAMVTMIEDLIAKGHAYEKDGHVLFRVRSYADYGALSGRSVDDMIAGARVEVAPFKEDPMDFVLWKPSSDDLPGWDSPWGRGRPGWHIECSAMSYELLGESFDIHGGGIDLQFPHHENELAQSCCAHPEGGFAKVWMHNEMLQVEGKKMSKSLGNFFTVRDLLDGRTLEGKCTGPEIRMSLLLSHYRSLMDFGVRRRHEARATLFEFAKVLGRDGSETLAALTPGKPLIEVVEALADDLDTSTAIKAVLNAAKPLPSDPQERRASLDSIYASQLLLGFDLKDSATAQDASRETDERRGTILKAINTVDSLHRWAAEIDKARASKDFARADAIREALEAAGVEVRVTKEGAKTTRLPNFDPTKLEGLE